MAEQAFTSYLVGGAVRDTLLGLPVRERDYVVVGSLPQVLLDLGFKQVGKDFPVFLHPVSHEEYALARTERKIAPGYHGFQVDFQPNVTLEEDLLRRDLTVNAMAMTAEGEIIDPFGGQRDLQAKVLRHISLAFKEDPVRILRVARFAAYLHAQGFSVAPETMQLMREMVQEGEVDSLVAERVWQEMERALNLPHPAPFWETLQACGALARLFPMWQGCRLDILQRAAVLSPEPRVRFAAVCYDLTLEQLQILSQTLRLPKAYRELAAKVITWQDAAQQALDLDASALLNLLEGLDAFRQASRFQEWLIVCQAAGLSEAAQLRLMRAREVVAQVDTQALQMAGLQGEAFKQALRAQRIQSLTFEIDNL